MEIIIRMMEPGEAPEVQRISKRAFKGLEGLGIPKPKKALVALDGEKIVGAIQMKLYRAGGKKVGYFDYAFIDPDYHNQGVGGILYKAAADFLWEQGCDALTALVKDDNVGSWSLFMKNGFGRISLGELAREFGLAGALRLYLGTILNIAIGMDYYVALRGRERPAGKGGSAKQIAAYFIANLLLSPFLFLERRESAGLFFTAYMILLAGGVFCGYLGTLFSGRGWRFRLCNGGGLICAFVNLMGGIYPMVGSWYPERYEKSGRFRRDMGVQAMTGWIFVLTLSLAAVLANGQHLLPRYLGHIGSIFLLYRVVAIYPFEAFGGGRVYRWNKGIYLLLSAASLAVYALNFIRPR